MTLVAFFDNDRRACGTSRRERMSLAPVQRAVMPASAEEAHSFGRLQRRSAWRSAGLTTTCIVCQNTDRFGKSLCHQRLVGHQNA
jgi:hypothetical protein